MKKTKSQATNNNIYLSRIPFANQICQMFCSNLQDGVKFEIDMSYRTAFLFWFIITFVANRDKSDLVSEIIKYIINENFDWILTASIVFIIIYTNAAVNENYAISAKIVIIIMCQVNVFICTDADKVYKSYIAFE